MLFTVCPNGLLSTDTYSRRLPLWSFLLHTLYNALCTIYISRFKQERQSDCFEPTCETVIQLVKKEVKIKMAAFRVVIFAVLVSFCVIEAHSDIYDLDRLREMFLEYNGAMPTTTEKPGEMFGFIL